jgi:hypothetical protein
MGGSCTVPQFEGPEIQQPPDAFFMQPESYSERRMFPEQEVVHHNAWVNTAWGEFSTIYINGHPGRLGRSAVEAALEVAKDAATEPVTFGGIEELTIDDRPAWGWAERLETRETGLEWIGYHVAIQYDTVTYTVELFSGDPSFKRQPDTLRAVAATFAVGETEWNIPLIAVLIGAALLAFKFVRNRAEQRDDRARHVTLVTIKKDEGEKEGEGEREGEGAARPAIGGGATVPAAPTAGAAAAPGAATARTAPVLAASTAGRQGTARGQTPPPSAPGGTPDETR